MELLESKVTLELGLELINPINYHKIKSMLYNVSWHNKKNNSRRNERERLTSKSEGVYLNE